MIRFNRMKLLYLIAGIVEIHHEIKSPAWSGKTTEGKASPSDCLKTANMISDEALYMQLIIAVLCNFGN